MKKPLPADFVEKVEKAEEGYRTEWRRFDRKNRDKILYYGLFRGQAMGEFKLAFDEGGRVKDSIFLLLLGGGHSAVRYPRVKKFNGGLRKSGFTLKDKGIGYYGRFGSLVKLHKSRAEGLYLTGIFRFSAGIYGLLSGKAFGIRIGSPKNIKGAVGIRNAKLLEQVLRVRE